MENFNVVVALKIWGHAWANKSIQIMCDNLAVLEVLSFSRARDTIMATCAKNVWLLAAMFNIEIVVSHIRGSDNTVADLLSRWNQTPDNFQKLYDLIESPVWVNTHLDLSVLNDDI